MAQWKRAGLITQRSVDRDYLVLRSTSLSKKKQLCLKNLLIIGNSELRLGKILQTTRDEMLVLDNPLSPESGSSSRPIVIDSSSEQESLNPVTTVYQQPTEQPVLERSMALQNLIEDDIELDILEMNSF